MDSEFLTQIIAGLGVAGVLAWYLYYDTTVAKPRAETIMMDRIDAIVDRQLASTERINANFVVALKEERAAYNMMSASLIEEIHSMRDERICGTGKTNREATG